MDELKSTAAHIARDSSVAAKRVAAAIRRCGTDLGEFASGRPGRVEGTFEKSVPRLPYILAYALVRGATGEELVILRVIHRARNWPDREWPKP